LPVSGGTFVLLVPRARKEQNKNHSFFSHSSANAIRESIMSTVSDPSRASRQYSAKQSSSGSAGGTSSGAGAAVAAPPVVPQSARTRRLTLSYYPWITQSISGAPLHRAIADFADLLQTELRRGMGEATHLQHLDAMEVPDQLGQIGEPPQGELTGKIGLLNPVGYAMIHKRVATVEAITVIRRKIGNEPAGPTYKAQFYAHRRTFLRNFTNPESDLKVVRGRSLAFGSPQSTSNFLVPAAMLFDAGIHPLNGLSRVEFTGGHDKAAAAVYEGRLEVGVGHDGVIFDLAGKPGYKDAETILQRIVWSSSIPSDPVAIHTADAAVREEVRNALIRVATPGQPNSDGNKVVKRFWGTDEGFEPIAASAYDSLLELMERLKLREDDMLRKI
jgi:phosphonate transport system substrate-binding protein